MMFEGEGAYTPPPAEGQGEEETTKETGDLVDISAYFKQREEAVGRLDKELAGLSSKLLALVPSGLSQWNEEYLGDVDSLNKWLVNLWENNKSGVPNSMKIRQHQLKEFGFKSLRSAREHMLQLKEAWKGIVDVTAVIDGGRVEVSFSIPKEKA